MYRSAIEHDEKEISDKKFEIKNTEKLISGCQDDIQNLQKSEKDRIYKFGPQMAALVSDIEHAARQGRFKHKPKGPIGMFIDTHDFSYSVAIEACIGPFMTSFICENYQDERALYQLINSHIKQ